MPSALQKDIVKKAKKHLEKKVAAGGILSEKDFPNHWRDRKKEVLMALWEHHNHKCCYCERERDPNGEVDIEHFRPKQKTEDGKPAYWWLAYDWNNLFFSCKACNISKLVKFPLFAGSVRASGLDRDLSKESPFFPHPIDENPEKYIGYMFDDYSTPADFVRPYGRDNEGRGDTTIRAIGLGRNNLIDEQARSLRNLETYVTMYQAAEYLTDNDLKDKAIAEIKRLTSPNIQFAGLNRAFFSARGIPTIIISQER